MIIIFWSLVCYQVQASRLAWQHNFIPIFFYEIHTSLQQDWVHLRAEETHGSVNELESEMNYQLQPTSGILAGHSTHFSGCNPIYLVIGHQRDSGKLRSLTYLWVEEDGSGDCDHPAAAAPRQEGEANEGRWACGGEAADTSLRRRTFASLPDSVVSVELVS